MRSEIIISNFDPQGPFAGLVLPKWVLDVVRYNDTHRFKVREWKGPRFQRGSVGVSVFANAAQQGAGGGAVELTNHTLSSFDFGALVTCRVVFQSDGTLVHDDDGTLTDVQAGEWGVDEPSTTGANFECRYLSAGDSGDAYGAPAAAADTWITIDADRSWGLTIVAKQSPSSKTHTSTFEVGDVGTSTADASGVITLNADN